MRRTTLTASLIALTAGAALATVAVLESSFLGAPAGVAQPFQSVPLPPLKPNLSTSSGGVPLAHRPASPFEPTMAQLLEGELVIRNTAQMKDVWAKLFNAPYDASLFDFQHDFVVLMGGGVLPPGASFDISSVESVDAEYANAGGLGGDTALDAFLSVTATTFLPGVQQTDPPPSAIRVSAVRVPKDIFDDVVFHRLTVLGV